jgi:hypothetical protein
MLHPTLVGREVVVVRESGAQKMYVHTPYLQPMPSAQYVRAAGWRR